MLFTGPTRIVVLRLGELHLCSQSCSTPYHLSLGSKPSAPPRTTRVRRPDTRTGAARWTWSSPQEALYPEYDFTTSAKSPRTLVSDNGKTAQRRHVHEHGHGQRLEQHDDEHGLHQRGHHPALHGVVLAVDSGPVRRHLHLPHHPGHRVPRALRGEGIPGGPLAGAGAATTLHRGCGQDAGSRAHRARRQLAIGSAYRERRRGACHHRPPPDGRRTAVAVRGRPSAGSHGYSYCWGGVPADACCHDDERWLPAVCARWHLPRRGGVRALLAVCGRPLSQAALWEGVFFGVGAGSGSRRASRGTRQHETLSAVVAVVNDNDASFLPVQA